MKSMIIEHCKYLLISGLFLCIQSALAVNLVMNPGMEYPCGENEADSWCFSSDGYTMGSAERLDWNAHSGSYSTIIPGTWYTEVDYGSIGQSVPVVGGQTYLFRAYFLIDNGWSADKVSCDLTWSKINHFPIHGFTNSLQSLERDQWVLYEWCEVAPANASNLEIRIACEGVGPNGAFSIDDVSLVLLSDSTPAVTPGYLTTTILDPDTQTNRLLQLHNTGTNPILFTANADDARFCESISVPAASNLLLSCVIDMNTNGYPDIPTSFTDQSVINWYEYINGTWNCWTSSLNTTARNLTYSTDDFDGDGDIDLIGICTHTNRIVWFENANGNGTSFQPHTITLPAWNYYIAVGDIDADNDIDIVYLTLSSASHGTYVYDVHCYENMDGNGQNWQDRPLFQQLNVSNIRLADLDADTDLDIIFRTSVPSPDPLNRHKLFICLNHETEDIAWEKSYHSILNVDRCMEIEDIDNNGIPNLILDEGYLAWWEWKGSNQWTQLTDTSIYLNNYMQVADADNDGDPDLVTDKNWWENAGSNTVEWIEHSIPIMNSSNIRMVDMDRDGDKDLLTTTAWYRNRPSSSSGTWLDVLPASGELASGQTIDLTLQYDATGLTNDITDMRMLNIRVNGNSDAILQTLVQLVIGRGEPNNDDDHDGLDNYWEQINGLNRLEADAYDDLDHDGASNINEFRSGTRANNSASSLEICSIIQQGEFKQFTCKGGTNVTQYLMFSPSITSPDWHCIFTNRAPQNETTSFQLQHKESGYYRLLLPDSP